MESLAYIMQPGKFLIRKVDATPNLKKRLLELGRF